MWVGLKFTCLLTDTPTHKALIIDYDDTFMPLAKINS